MNCPRCGKEMVVAQGKATCDKCRMSVSVAESPKAVPAPAPAPVPETSNEVDPDEIEEESAPAEGFPEEDDQKSGEEAKE